jgi:small-conductance mechanosensitive channel
MDFGQGLTDAWRAVATFVPKLAAFLLILLIGWFVAKAVAKLVDKVLERVGFDRLVERGGVRQMLSRSKYDASDLLAKLVYYALILITLQIAFGVWGPNPVSVLLTGIVAWLPKAAVAIIIVVVAGAIASAAKDFISGALGGLSYGRVLANIASIFIWALGIIAALNQIGVATTVTTPVLIAVLATAGGILVVGVGGGLVRPMQQRWEGWLGRAEQELPQAQAQAEAYQRGREDAVRAGAETTPVAPAEPEPVTTTQRQVPTEDPVLGARRPEDLNPS